MPGVPPPNPDLQDLAALLGEDNSRLLVRTFLAEYPPLLQGMVGTERATQQRLAHSLKSNTRVVGLRDISAQMAQLEARLGANGAALTAAELDALKAEFEIAAGPLRAFVG